VFKKIHVLTISLVFGLMLLGSAHATNQLATAIGGYDTVAYFTFGTFQLKKIATSLHQIQSLTPLNMMATVHGRPLKTTNDQVIRKYGKSRTISSTSRCMRAHNRSGAKMYPST